MAKPRKIAAPKSSVGGDIASVLGAISKGGAQPRGRGVSIRRSQNPARVNPDKGLRVTRAKLPTAAELYRDTAAPLGEGPRAKGIGPAPVSPTMPTAQELFDLTAPPGGAFDAELLGRGGGEEERPDRTEYLSPPPSLDPDRPRAREAQYNPDNRELRVVFRNGGSYTYFGVPPQTWRALKSNRSFGQTMDRLIINRYQYERTSF